MSSSIKGGIKTLGNDDPIGDHGYSPLDEVSKATQTPRSHSNPVASYVVPAGKKFTCKSIVLASHPGMYYGTIGTGRVGTCKLRVNGADKAEFYPQAIGWSVPGGYCTSSQRLMTMGLLHDGLTFANGDVVDIQITLTTTTRQVKAVGWFFGKETTGGADVEVMTRADITGTGAKTVVTYTVGANGLTLLSYGVEFQMVDQAEVALAELMIGGKPIFDTFITSEPTAKTWDFYMTIPLHDGMVFYPGEEVRLDVADIHQSGDSFSMMVCGDEEPLASGTYPVAGDVDQGVSYGPTGTEYTGTLAQPAQGDVKKGVTYGAGGTEFTGTLEGGTGKTIIIRSTRRID